MPSPDTRFSKVQMESLQPANVFYVDRLSISDPVCMPSSRLDFCDNVVCLNIHTSGIGTEAPRTGVKSLTAKEAFAEQMTHSHKDASQHLISGDFHAITQEVSHAWRKGLRIAAYRCLNVAVSEAKATSQQPGAKRNRVLQLK